MTAPAIDLDSIHLDSGSHGTADEALQPTVDTLQASALDLFAAMISPSAVAA